jgi:hypothetical protein
LYPSEVTGKSNSALSVVEISAFIDNAVNQMATDTEDAQKNEIIQMFPM